MRALQFAKWVWQSAVVIGWIWILLGFHVGSSGMTGWVVSAEVWLTNHVPDPILFAFFTGLLVSTVLVPYAWTAFRHRIFPSQSTLILEDLITHAKYNGESENFFRIRNSGPDSLDNCLVKIIDTQPLGGRKVLFSPRALRPQKEYTSNQTPTFSLQPGETRDIPFIDVGKYLSGGETHYYISVQYSGDRSDTGSLYPPQIVTVGLYGAKNPTVVKFEILGLDAKGALNAKRIEK